MEKLKILVLQGIPASGKSTWAREFIKAEGLYWVIVNRDSMRNMLGDYWVPTREKLIDSMEESSVILALNRNYNVIIDATNLNPKTIAKWSNLATEYGADIEFKLFNVALDEAIKRDSLRDKPVGAKVIKDFYFKYIGSGSESIKTDNRFILEQNHKLPKCIIVDIDGTLALINGRNPYNDSLVHTDKVNKPVLDIVKKYDRMYYIRALNLNHTLEDSDKIIIMSGREEKCREQTEEWLKNNGVPYYQLYMRTTGDNRKDSIVKRELYEEHIKDKYYVDFVLDDRNQVVDMWRELGLLCLQVYYGNF